MCCFSDVPRLCLQLCCIFYRFFFFAKLQQIGSNNILPSISDKPQSIQPFSKSTEHTLLKDVGTWTELYKRWKNTGVDRGRLSTESHVINGGNGPRKVECLLGPVHTKTIVNANASKRIFLSPSTRRRSSFT